MTRVLIGSFRDDKNRKYKLYRDDEQEQWTVVSDAQLFGGTREDAEAFLKGLGLEVPESIPSSVEESERAILDDEKAEVSDKAREMLKPLEPPSEEAESVTEAPLESKTSSESSELQVAGDQAPTEDGSKEEAETNQTMSEAERIDAEIAELKAKREELKK